MVDGMTWGVGSAVAHRAMDGLLGPRTVNVEHTYASPGDAAPMPAPAPIDPTPAPTSDSFPSWGDAPEMGDGGGSGGGGSLFNGIFGGEEW